ncbi:MAG: CRISPR system precrRNA processing endoribonuclease RAMP protein Cas6 [Desulfuromonadales bacterium]|nr:CRISPR system precrRNA processing endoribonuclease RAMP protein Cas6 [Desulfuromonadales bacterium]
MSNLFPVPDTLRRAEYARLFFQLEAREYFDLPPLALQRLRREFRQAVRYFGDSGDQLLTAQLNGLLAPPPPDDLKLRKLVQKPAPPFVLSPDPQRVGLVEPGEWLELPVLFLGSGIRMIDPFARMLQQVGRQGLVNGQGKCALATVEVEDASGRRTTLWNGGPLEGALLPVVNDLCWWLELQPPEWDNLTLTFRSPLRLMRGGKPLFKSNFAELFPFVLRRVTAMLAGHCQVETVTDPSTLLDAAFRVEECANRLQWRDWRSLTADDGGQDLGGLSGTLDLSGSDLADLLWVLRLGSLLQVGKGAPYGAGHYLISRRNG